ncbi:unnamed protein product, partial [Amoebophrya sp. A120]|eukprot:GSA120T00015868001.1
MFFPEDEEQEPQPADEAQLGRSSGLAAGVSPLISCSTSSSNISATSPLLRRGPASAPPVPSTAALITASSSARRVDKSVDEVDDEVLNENARHREVDDDKKLPPSSPFLFFDSDDENAMKVTPTPQMQQLMQQGQAIQEEYAQIVNALQELQMLG